MTIKEIETALSDAYGIKDRNDGRAEQGCYLNGKWLSIKNVVEIIEHNCSND